MTINEQASNAAVQAAQHVLEEQDALYCTRSWKAWDYDTMTADDFVPVAADKQAVSEIVNATLEAAMPHIREQIAQEIEVAQFKVDSLHHFHGAAKCLCGYDSHHRARSATEHITQALNAAGIVRGES